MTMSQADHVAIEQHAYVHLIWPLDCLECDVIVKYIRPMWSHYALRLGIHGVERNSAKNQTQNYAPTEMFRLLFATYNRPQFNGHPR